VERLCTQAAKHTISLYLIVITTEERSIKRKIYQVNNIYLVCERVGKVENIFGIYLVIEARIQLFHYDLLF
jgi:uncharacterized membrane protein YkgB